MVDSNIVAKVRTDDRRMIQANGQLQIAVIQVTWTQIADTDQTIEFTVLNLIRIKDFRYLNLGPVAGPVSIVDQLLNLRFRQITVVITRVLLKAQGIFVLSCWNKLIWDKSISQMFQRFLLQYTHRPPYSTVTDFARLRGLSTSKPSSTPI